MSILIDDSDGLAFYKEGIFTDWNFRDVGESLNQCLGENVFQSGKVYRSNQLFSGWPCKLLNYPGKIISLNFDPDVQKRFYCWDDRDNTLNIGVVPDPSIKLNDLEFIESWQKPEMRRGACDAVREIAASIQSKQSTLFHCTAGRDRTGTMAALFYALALEDVGRLNQRSIEALECDYRKTKSLKSNKHGRIEDFLVALQKYGGCF